MTVNEYRTNNPGKVFYLKGTRGHVFSPIAVNGLIPEVYQAKVLGIGTMKLAKVPCLKIDYDFLAQ